MKLLIASDIHGSALYCEKLIDRFGKEQADKLILLGDILYHGPRNDLPDGYAPKKVIDLLNPLADKILCVSGNCDTQVDQMVLNFPVLAEQAIIYADGIEMFAAHGHKQAPKLCKNTVLLNGHTHIPEYCVTDTFIRINPGSVSIPKENSPRGYILYENKAFIWKTLDGDTYREEKIV